MAVQKGNSSSLNTIALQAILLVNTSCSIRINLQSPCDSKSERGGIAHSRAPQATLCLESAETWEQCNSAPGIGSRMRKKKRNATRKR
eukprot:2526549-Rhodomonas_salina.3